jgi:hypothetical protein
LRTSERSSWHLRLRRTTFASALSTVCEKVSAGPYVARSRGRSPLLRNRWHDGSRRRHRPSVVEPELAAILRVEEVELGKRKVRVSHSARRGKVLARVADDGGMPSIIFGATGVLWGGALIVSGFGFGVLVAGSWMLLERVRSSGSGLTAQPMRSLYDSICAGGARDTRTKEVLRAWRWARWPTLSTNIEHPSQPADGQAVDPGANMKWYRISWRRPSKRSSRSGRWAEALGSSWTFLDLTPLGRQETWEDSPAGWPADPALCVVASPRQVRDRRLVNPAHARVRSRRPRVRRSGP